MKKFNCLFIFLAIVSISPKSLAANSPDVARENLGQGLSRVWVIDDKHKANRHPFIWVVNDTKQARNQPFLQIAKGPAKPSDKPIPGSKPGRKDELAPFDEITKDTQKQEGLFNFYRQKDKNKIFLEVKPEQLNRNFLTTVTLESGIGEAGIYSGMPLQYFMFYFQRQGNNLNFVVRNVHFRTREGDPQARSLARSFSDSVLYSIPIKSIHAETKNLLVDLGDLLLTDLAGLSSALGIPYGIEQSYFGGAKAFPQNIEVESVFGFTGVGKQGEPLSLEAVPDSRAFTLRVRYSLSQMPDNNYRPRLADDRVGYFLTAYQDISSDERRDPFVRYVNRWKLEKQDPEAPLSPPKKPIVFWIDNAVPFEYREPIKQGILMWNKGFEAAGFKDAIQVQQMPNDAKWDPADIRYNTIRWINTIDGNFALGPSRVNPLNGEILDADILVDAGFLRTLKQEYRNIVEPQGSQAQTRSSLMGLIRNRNLCNQGFLGRDKFKLQNGQQNNQPDNQQNNQPDNQQNKGPFLTRLSKMAEDADICYGMESANQFEMGNVAMSLLQNTLPSSDVAKKYIHQYLRLIIAHEVGHTLGLRHNFRGSNMLQPEDMNNTEITRNRGLTASVMDYLPPNIARQGQKQGDFFPNSIGPYDIWAIRYGYTPIKSSSTTAEKPALQEILKESEKPELSYATDEDILDLDPTADVWDNSGDVLRYSQWQLENSRIMVERLNKRYPIEGESYSDVRDRFGAVLNYYLNNVNFVAKYVGGQSFYRLYGSDTQKSSSLDNRSNRLPFESVPVEKQREALATLQKYVFAEDAFNYPPDLLNKLAPSRWRHWGSFPRIGRLDLRIHDIVSLVQGSVLFDLLSNDRLSRLKDIEFKNKPGESLTLPELFDTLQTGIWTEVLKPKSGGIKISSLRRGLQRQHLDMLSGMVLRTERVPEDARSLAWYKLRQLDEKLKNANSSDDYTKAHLLESRDRIRKVLNSPIPGN